MRDRRRADLAIVIALACLFALVWMQGCSSFKPEFQWVKTEDASAGYEWIHVSRERMYAICQRDPSIMANLGGCAFNDPGRLCRVYSMLDEAGARLRLSGDGLTLYEHEVWNASKTIGHCAGYRHQ